MTDRPDPLGRRDLRPVEPLLPALHRLVRRYFRAEVEGLERIPDDPVLLVANHSGGTASADSVVFVLAFLERFGTERPLFWLGHELLLRVPVLGEMLGRFGVVTADPEDAREILTAGGSVVVYPGGELELHRPWTERNEVQFFGRTGFLRLARDAGVPIVPVVAHGAHNTYLPLTSGRRLAQALRLDRVANVKAFPVALSVPWGVEIGGVVPHLPLPARIRVRVLDPVRVAPDADLDELYTQVTVAMQGTLDELAAAD